MNLRTPARALGLAMVGVLLAGCTWWPLAQRLLPTPPPSPTPAASAGVRVSPDPAVTPAIPTLAPGAMVEGSLVVRTAADALAGVTWFHLRDETTWGWRGPYTQVMEGDVAFADEPRADVRLTGLGLPQQLVVIDEDVFVRVGASGWEQLTADQAQADFLPDPLGTLSILDILAKHTTSGAYVGEETVRGVLTRRYVMGLDAAAADAVMTYEGDDGTPPQDAFVNRVELWLDDWERPVRISLQVRHDRGQMSSVTDLSAFDQAIEIVPPPATQVRKR